MKQIAAFSDCAIQGTGERKPHPSKPNAWITRVWITGPMLDLVVWLTDEELRAFDAMHNANEWNGNDNADRSGGHPCLALGVL